MIELVFQNNWPLTIGQLNNWPLIPEIVPEIERADLEPQFQAEWLDIEVVTVEDTQPQPNKKANKQ